MKKKTYIEVLRIIAAFLVIVNHTDGFIYLYRTPGLTWLCSVAYFFLCKPAVPLFLMITGGLLLGKEDTPRQTLKRILRTLAVFVPGSVIYYIYYQLRLSAPIRIDRLIYSFLTGTSTNAFWYFWLYLGLLCTLPILQKLAKALSRRQLEYLLLLSLGLNGLLPLIGIFIRGQTMSPNFYEGLIGPYLGMVLLGYYLEQYVSMDRKGCLICVGVLLVLIAAQTAGTLLLYYRNPSSYTALDSRILLPVTASAACIYLCVKYLVTRHPPGPRLERAICGLGKLTFGIYLLGDMAINLSGPLYGALTCVMHVLPAMLLWELFVFTCCALACAILRLIPPLRRVL